MNCLENFVSLSPSLEEHENKIFEFLSQENGWPPLLYAIEIEKAEIVEHLIDLGADVNQEDVPNCLKSTPLTHAIFKENVKIVEILIKSGANVNQEDDLGLTPLTTVRRKGF